MSLAVIPAGTLVPETKKSNHRANIVRISKILPHNNADNLELIHIGEYQVVARRGQFNTGDYAVYIQPDSVIPQTEPFRFIWEGNVGTDGKVPEKRRRITVRKFRGEWSEGLLLPVQDFHELVESRLTTYFSPFDFPEGTDVSDLIGVTHYDPDAGKESTSGETSSAPRRKYPRTLKGWVFYLLHRFTGRGQKNFSQEVSFSAPTYDVEAFKNYGNAFVKGEQVHVTEKIHGSNARFVFLDGVMYAGSRTQWKSAKSPCIWRKALAQNSWIERWCKKHEGYILYGEVTPTQKGFDYGSKPGEAKFFVFDVLSPEGEWLTRYDLEDSDMDQISKADLLFNMVPMIYDGPWLFPQLTALASGNSLVEGAKHIREGVVISPSIERHQRGLGRVKLKIVSNEFLHKDSK